MAEEDIWDEHQWEDFLAQQDREIEAYMRHFHQFMAANPPPPRHDKAAVEAWEQGLKAFLKRQGWRMEDGSFVQYNPGDEDSGASDTDTLFFPDAPDSVAFGDDELCQRAERIKQGILAWSDALPGGQKDSALVHFCTSVTDVFAHLKRAWEFGLERDMLGGNIACVKRALDQANLGLRVLRDLRTRRYMLRSDYQHLSEEVYELRNQIALHLDDLRTRFDLGID